MARQILGQKQAAAVTLTAHTASPVDRRIGARDSDKLLRTKRRSQYVEALSRLDAGCHLQNPQSVQALIEALRAEFPELSLEQMPIGIVAKCYLGAPYEVHTLDVAQEIIQHYKKHQSLPVLLEKARVLAMHPSYAFIEVYIDSLRAISLDGEVSVIKE